MGCRHGAFHTLRLVLLRDVKGEVRALEKEERCDTEGVENEENEKAGVQQLLAGLGDKKKTLNPLSISLDPFKTDPKKNQNPDTKGSFEVREGPCRALRG